MKKSKKKNRVKSDKHGIPAPRNLGRSWLWWSMAALLFVIGSIQIVGQTDSINTTLVSQPNLVSVLAPLLLITLAVIMAYGLYLVEQQKSRWVRWSTPITLLLIGAIYLLSFNPQLAPNGDNAEYLIIGKSVVETGSVYRLDTPNETKNSLANLGLPLLLVPILKVWGMDLLKMKGLILILSLASFPLMQNLFKRHESVLVSTLLALIAYASPYLVANSSTIMTEAPYLFWSLCTLLATSIYAKAKKNQVLWGLAVVTCCGLTFLTRATGISMTLAVSIFLFLQIPLSQLKQSKFRGLTKDPSFLKFCAIVIPLLIALVAWQINLANSGVSHAKIISTINFSDNILNNVTALHHVWGQVLFSAEIFRWFRLSPDHPFMLPNLGMVLVQFLCLLGLTLGIFRRQLPAIYTGLLLLVILVGSQTPQERVLIRYISVLLPFLIFYFFQGAKFVTEKATSYLSNQYLKKFFSSLPLLLLFQLFLVELSGNHFNMRVKSPVHNEYYDSFLAAATWCGESLPKDAYIMSIKPRIVYTLSGLKGTYSASERDKYNDDWAQKKLAEIKTKKVTHIIVDAISVTTTENIYPLLQDHPDRFEALNVPGLNDKCTVVRVR